MKTSHRYVLGIDPSGNFNEGKGITGWCVFDALEERVVKVGSVRAMGADTQVGHWVNHLNMLRFIKGEYPDLVVSMEDFVLYARESKAQINSGMETSQLIGVIKVACYTMNIPLYIRTASRVMKRWTDTILCNKGYIFKVNTGFYVECRTKVTCDHERDALRHAVHCATFEIGVKDK